MVKVIKQGIDPQKTVHTGRCIKCKTVVEFERHEAEDVNDRDGHALVVDCPNCSRKIWVAA